MHVSEFKQSRSVLCILNPTAAGGLAGRRWPAWERVLRDAVSLRVELAQKPGAARRVARERAREFPIMIAAGGDGTVNEVTTGLIEAGAETCLAVAALGTGNDVAQLLGTTSPLSLAQALAEEQTRSVDVLNLTYGSGAPARCAILFAAVGFSGELLRLATPRMKRLLGGRLAYLAGFVAAVLRFEAIEMTVRSSSSGLETGRKFLLAASNTRYAGGGSMCLAPDASVRDGRLNVLLVDELRRGQALRFFPGLARGSHVGQPGVAAWTAEWVEVQTARPAEVQADGDSCGETPARIQVLPGRLRVLVGRHHTVH